MASQGCSLVLSFRLPYHAGGLIQDLQHRSELSVVHIFAQQHARLIARKEAVNGETHPSDARIQFPVIALSPGASSGLSAAAALPRADGELLVTHGQKDPPESPRKILLVVQTAQSLASRGQETIQKCSTSGFLAGLAQLPSPRASISSSLDLTARTASPRTPALGGAEVADSAVVFASDADASGERGFSEGQPQAFQMESSIPSSQSSAPLEEEFGSPEAEYSWHIAAISPPPPSPRPGFPAMKWGGDVIGATSDPRSASSGRVSAGTGVLKDPPKLSPLGLEISFNVSHLTIFVSWFKWRCYFAQQKQSPCMDLVLNFIGLGNIGASCCCAGGGLCDAYGFVSHLSSARDPIMYFIYTSSPGSNIYHLIEELFLTHYIVMLQFYRNAILPVAFGGFGGVSVCGSNLRSRLLRDLLS